MPQQEAGKYGPAYEDFFQEVSAGTPAPSADGWAFPALFKTAGGKWLADHGGRARRWLLRLASGRTSPGRRRIASSFPT